MTEFEILILSENFEQKQVYYNIMYVFVLAAVLAADKIFEEVFY